MLSAFESAEAEDDTDTMVRHLTFVIVGGGPTGVELAGSLGGNSPALPWQGISGGLTRNCPGLFCWKPVPGFCRHFQKIVRKGHP
ncbi:MAG: hypothetical protein R2860_14195 [Desulfobacterales bacterium]